MGNLFSEHAETSKRVIWCDTEGGMRDKPMWDITFVDEGPGEEMHALRIFDVSSAHKAGRAKLRKTIPLSVYCMALKQSRACIARYTISKAGAIGKTTFLVTSDTPKELVAAYLVQRKGCVLCAWNMRAHDKHVLRRLVGQEVLDNVLLWDALPWFRSRYTLPKNTMASDKPGTPRAVFKVKSSGAAHTSLADALHMRDVVVRAAYCCTDGNDLSAWKHASDDELFAAAQKQIADEVDVQEWIEVPVCEWNGDLPLSVKEYM